MGAKHGSQSGEQRVRLTYGNPCKPWDRLKTDPDMSFIGR